MYKIIFPNINLQINHCVKQGSMYYSSEEIDNELINDVLFNDIKIYDENTEELINEYSSMMCETLLFTDEEVEAGYKTKFQFYLPTDEQQAENRLKTIVQSLTLLSFDTTEIQEAITDLYEMILSK